MKSHCFISMGSMILNKDHVVSIREIKKKLNVGRTDEQLTVLTQIKLTDGEVYWATEDLDTVDEKIFW